MCRGLWYGVGLGLVLTLWLGGQEPPPKPAAGAPGAEAPPKPAADAKAERSPLDKIRITVTTQRRDTDYRTADPMGDPSRVPKPMTTNADGSVTEAEDSIKVAQDMVTVKVKVRNDGKLAATGAQVTVYYLGQMLKDAKLYRLLGRSSHTVDLAVKTEIELRPLTFVARGIGERRYQRGTRAYSWLVTVRDADGRLAALELPSGKDYLTKLLPTIEKAADLDANGDHVSFFTLTGDVVEASAATLDFPLTTPSKQ